MIFGIEHISSLNFSIPKKLYDLKIFFHKRIITFRFDEEEKKNKIGNDLKKKVQEKMKKMENQQTIEQNEEGDKNNNLNENLNVISTLEKKYEIAKYLEQ